MKQKNNKSNEKKYQSWEWLLSRINSFQLGQWTGKPANEDNSVIIGDNESSEENLQKKNYSAHACLQILNRT